MFRQFFLGATVACLMLASEVCCHDGPDTLVAAPAGPARPSEALLDEIVAWLSSNFDVPASKERPAIEFVPKIDLAAMRVRDGALSRHVTQGVATDLADPHRVVAVYNSDLKTIFLSDDWRGKSPADQSVLVHEMVHHLQIMAEQKFECPMAREKLAYLAQDKWLARFDMSLETEFEVDMFTIMVSSACIF